jgi:hypothetical protein
MSNWSGNTKRGLIYTVLVASLCTVQERRDPLENANCDSRGGMFSALACFHACWIGPKIRKWAWKGLVVVEIFEKQCGLVHRVERQLTLKNAFSDSRCRTLLGLHLWMLGRSVRWNCNRIRSAVAEKTVKHCAHSRFLSCCLTDTVFLSFLGNQWPNSGPFSIFLTDSTPLITHKGLEWSAARIWDCKFRGSQYVAGLRWSAWHSRQFRLSQLQ